MPSAEQSAPPESERSGPQKDGQETSSGTLNAAAVHPRILDNTPNGLDDTDQSSGGWGEQCFTIRLEIPYVICGLGTILAVALGVFAVLVYLIVTPPPPNIAAMMEEVGHRTGEGAVTVFQSFDLNGDGYMSIFEFESLIPHLNNLSGLLENVKPMDKFLEYEPEAEEEVLVLRADFTPLQMDTMTMEDVTTMDITGKNSLFGLKNWTEPNRKYLMLGASEFRSLLPEDLESLTLGEPYSLLPNVNPNSDVLSNARFYPRVPKGKVEGVLFRLLSMMHPKAFLELRFSPKGTLAAVQAYSDDYIRIVFRMHAEFQLNNPPLKPFWFTPAQFVGDLVMNRKGTHVHYFHMAVPNERRLNVDMEWLTGLQGSEGYDGMEVDIGYMPRMEWTMEAESHIPLSPEEAQSPRPDSRQPQGLDTLQWSQHVPREDALRSIEKAFYPFKEVAYHNLTVGLQLAREENKPLHAVFLWGALDDQSC